MIVNAIAIGTEEIAKAKVACVPAEVIRADKEVQTVIIVKGEIEVKDLELFFHPRAEDIHHLPQTDQPVHHGKSIFMHNKKSD